MNTGKISVSLFHRGVWAMDKLTVPLACGYLKSYAYAHRHIKDNFDIVIENYSGKNNSVDIVKDSLLQKGIPDIIGFSVYGWNYNVFKIVAETFKQLNPDGLVILGGPHVSHQAGKVFSACPSADIVVNGEGEISFYEILNWYLESREAARLGGIAGISYRDGTGIRSNPDREKIKDLNTIPSPFLTETFPLVDGDGKFIYDAITMETNRGCPYKCSFCHWGGATNSRMYKFDQERVYRELELFARHGVENVCLADSNYGMTKEDEQFLDIFLEIRKRHGFPRFLITSWAKNKGKHFYSILRKMKSNDLRTDFTLSLQTLSPDALETAQRRNMKINDFAQLCEFLNREGLGAHAELIWQLPGETYDSFLNGYDKVAENVSKIAIYNNLIIPNTHYYENKARYGLITIRSEDSDFEHVISHRSMTFADNVRMHHFIFWARLFAERMFLRHVFAPMRVLKGASQSRILLSFDEWLEGQHDPVAERLRGFKYEAIKSLDVTKLTEPLVFLYSCSGVQDLMSRWWDETYAGSHSGSERSFYRELMRYDHATRPVHAVKAKADGLETVRLGDKGMFYRSRELEFTYDIAHILGQIGDGVDEPVLTKATRKYVYYHKCGFEDYIDNQDITTQYLGKRIEEILSPPARLWEADRGTGSPVNGRVSPDSVFPIAVTGFAASSGDNAMGNGRPDQ